MWVVLARSEVNVCAPRVGDGSQRRCLVSDVNANVRKVSAESSLHLCAHLRRQRQATGLRPQRHSKRFDARLTLALNRLWRASAPQIESRLKHAVTANDMRLYNSIALFHLYLLPG